ncbi:HAMP domain-containing histidine kinase [bacterium]|nr:HAMP domain-containing histidine kinase [bacterium]
MLENRRLTWILSAQVAWLLMVSLIGGWWVNIVLTQADQIAELREAAGLESSVAESERNKTHRMIKWESLSFLALLISSSGALFGLYWRDAKRNRSIQAFFASLTHELRTPLTSIRLQAETIGESFSNENLIRRLMEDVSRLEAQVDRTLELARVEGGGQVYVQPVPIKTLVERLLKSWTEAHGQRLKISQQIDDQSVLADLSAVQTIFKNLLENSLRHSNKEVVEVSLKTELTDKEVGFYYHDHSSTFEGNTARLGKLFYKGPKSQGAGVGLYLISVLMDRMSGRVQFSSPKEGGFLAALWFKRGGSLG